MTGYKGSVLNGMDTQHVAFCCIERCNPLTTTLALGAVNFFVRRSGMECRYMAIFWPMGSNISGLIAKNLGAYARQGSNYSVCPFSPIDSRGRVVILLNICAPTRTLHTDALR